MSAANKPNIVFILIDDLRHDCIGVAPDKRNLKRYLVDDLVRTPQLDSLAENGVYFTQAISTATQTTPSVASIFTGTWAPVHGIRTMLSGPVNKEVKTLFEHLGRAGYDTAACNTHDFTEFNGTLNGCRIITRNKWISERHQPLLNRVVSELSQPFCLYLHLWGAHIPFCLSAYPYQRHKPLLDFLNRFFEYYDIDKPNMPFESMNASMLEETWMHLWNSYFEQGIANPVEWQLPLYVQGVNALDAGRLKGTFKFFDNKKILKNTIFVILADHGEAVNFKFPTEEPKFMHNCFPSEDAVRVPLIFYAPDILPRGVRVDSQVSTADIVPTLLDILEINQLDGPVNGQSLTSRIFNGARKNSIAYSEFAKVDSEDLKNAIEQKCRDDGKIHKFNWMTVYRSVRTPEYKYVELGEPLAESELKLPISELLPILNRKRGVMTTDPAAMAPGGAVYSRFSKPKEFIRFFESYHKLIMGRRLYDLRQDPDEFVNLLARDPYTFESIARPLIDTLREIWKMTIAPDEKVDMLKAPTSDEMKNIAERLRGLGYID